MPGAERSPAPPVRGTARSTLAPLTAALALAGGLVAGCGSPGPDHPVPASSSASLTQPAAMPQADAIRALRDDGPVQVVHGKRSVVVSSRRSGVDASDLTRRVDEAVPVATRFWRTAWAQPVVVLVPASLAHWTSLTGLSPDPDVAAVSIGASSAEASTEASGATGAGSATGTSGTSGTSGATQATGTSGTPGATQATGTSGTSNMSGDGQRIVVDPGAYLRLSDAGRGVVLRHEVEHLVSASHTPPGMPSWLVEGTADVVGFTGSGIPVSQAAEELAALVRNSGAPASLPVDADFSGGSSSVAYEEGWLACRLIYREKGAAALRAFYDGVAAGIRARSDSPTHEDLVGGALQQATGWSLADFVARWRADLQLELGSAP